MVARLDGERPNDLTEQRREPMIAFRITILIIFLILGDVCIAQTMILSDFNDDTPGQPPAIGGPNEPATIINGGVLVQASANGLNDQPLTLDDGSCDSTYFGGVTYDLAAPVTQGVVRIEATVATNQFIGSPARTILFDSTESGLGASIARLGFREDGMILSNDGVELGSYLPNEPFRFRADIDMTTKTWAASIDDELNGFDDDSVASGLQFVNPPGIIDQIGTAIMTMFGSFTSCTGSRIIAYDDITITDFVIFKDGFESGDTSAWSVP